MPTAELLDERSLDDIEREWDELAVACARPGSAPALLMAWWRHLAPTGARARVVAVREGGRLVGLAPFLVHDGPLGRPAARLFGTPSLPQRATILAAPGHEAAVWPLVARTLGRSEPRPAVVSLERVDGDAAWPRALARAWPAPAGARRLWEFRIPGQALSMRAGSFDAWMAGRSHNARRDVRRTARRVERRGATIVRADGREQMERALEAFGRLHELRWGGRSRLWRPDALAMLREAGEGLRGSGRIRLYAMEADGGIVATLVVFAAGGEAMAWNGAWEPDWAPVRPMMALFYRAIEDCFALGDRRLDFGEGEQQYKLRLTDARDPVAWA
ncbi:MAG TPA: GNAT family N-acetyltransferase, partial [Miltoncostaeaceae bacterium]|nr:GNAT family N-acetyltransferase [Miltoncostaeaceae bacterium]